MKQRQQWIMVAGPYRSGSDDPAVWKENLMEMNRAAVEVYRKGHVPIIGVNMALPMIETVGEDTYSELMMPVSLALAERCDAILRIGGPSSGADKEVDVVTGANRPVYHNLKDIPIVDEA